MKIFGSEITPYKYYLNRRALIKGALATSLFSFVPDHLYANHNNNLNDFISLYISLTLYFY